MSPDAPRGRIGPAQNPMSDPAFVAGLRPIPTGPLQPTEQWPATDIAGLTPDGEEIVIRIDAVGGPILLAFLHTRCDGCDGFWRGLSEDTPEELPASVAAVIVTKSPPGVDASEVATLSSGIRRSPVVMSDEAWTAYRVVGYPFFVLIDPVSRTVVGETVGFGWSDVNSMIRAAGH